MVDVGLQVFLSFTKAGTVFLCFKLSKLGFNAIYCISFGQYLACKLERKKCKLIGAGSNAGGSGISLWHSENFAMVAKISQSKRKFRYGQIFAIIAKITVHRENATPLFVIQTTPFCVIPILLSM